MLWVYEGVTMDIRMLIDKFPQLMGKQIESIAPFQREEDGTDYDVWMISTEDGAYVLKKAKGRELSVYTSFLGKEIQGAPRFYASTHIPEGDYFLMEYVSGESLCKCTRSALIAALDALISLQDMFWENHEYDNVGFTFSDSMAGRLSRGEYLKDADLEAAYSRFLDLYRTLPRTFCHDDLLPFNLLISENGATIIDWEQAGMLPYPVSFARLIAHGTEESDAFFYMTEDDKHYAIDYYYDHLIKGKGIAYCEYRRALNYFLLYEYCEWIMLGNRYEDADMDRYRKYYAKAKEHILSL